MPSDRPPSYTQSHDPRTLNLHSVPAMDLLPMHNERRLPPLPSTPAESRVAPEPLAESHFWPSSNPLTAYYQPGPSRLSPKTKASESPNTVDVDTPDSRGWRGSSVLSIDDPDVRLAAEALGDLRAGMPYP
jgi:hypothetical protein